MTPIYVVTVCRNALSDLIITLDSVSQQANQRVHHIVIDGASSDGTPDYLSRRHPPPHLWISEKDHGIYDAMNKAVAHCPDEAWVIFLNAGDIFALPDTINKLGDYLDSKADIIIGDVLIRTEVGRTILRKANISKRVGLPACHQSLLARANLLKAFPFNTNYRVGADYDFYARATQKGRQIAIFPAPISQIAPEGFSAQNEPTLQADYYKIISQHVGRLKAMRWLFSRRRRAWSRKIRCRLNLD